VGVIPRHSQKGGKTKDFIIHKKRGGGGVSERDGTTMVFSQQAGGGKRREKAIKRETWKKMEKGGGHFKETNAPRE